MPSTPRRLRRRAAALQRREIGANSPLQLLLEPGLGVQRDRCRVCAIAHDRAAHAPRQRAAAARDARQAQRRLDLAGQLVAQVQEPAAAERRAPRSPLARLRSARQQRVERVQESLLAPAAAGDPRGARPRAAASIGPGSASSRS